MSQANQSFDRAQDDAIPSCQSPGAVLVPDGPDAGQPWHYGDPFAEQRRLDHGLTDKPAGVWAREALRIAARQPRPGLDDDPSAPIDWVLRLVHLDGSADEPLPPVGTALTLDGVTVGRLGSTAQHYELGPIGLALVAPDVTDGTTVLVGATPALITT